jgi:glyoxylase-like metal-dependent hydrolase (beta-lactamase superfamily II)
MNIEVLKIEKAIDGEPVVLFPVLLQHAGRNYLVDCGYEETSAELEHKLKALGIEPEDLTGVIITHDDHDHLGGLCQLKQKNKNLKVVCGELEKDSVSGKIKSERLLQAEMSLNILPEEYRGWALNFIEKLKKVQRFAVDEVLCDNAIFEEELIVIHTPGHTKGHVSLFLPKEKTVIAGDALVIENGEFNIANPSFTLDLQQALKSVERIKNLNPLKIICFHGGIMDKNVNEKLEALLILLLSR